MRSRTPARLAAILTLALTTCLVSSCGAPFGGTGPACEYSDGSVHTCSEVDESTSEDIDEDAFCTGADGSGATMTRHEGKTCEEVGYPTACGVGSGTIIYSASSSCDFSVHPDDVMVSGGFEHDMSCKEGDICIYYTFERKSDYESFVGQCGSTYLGDGNRCNTSWASCDHKTSTRPSTTYVDGKSASEVRDICARNQ